jgi:hypothetical protein
MSSQQIKGIKKLQFVNYIFSFYLIFEIVYVFVVESKETYLLSFDISFAMYLEVRIAALEIAISVARVPDFTAPLAATATSFSAIAVPCLAQPFPTAVAIKM